MAERPNETILEAVTNAIGGMCRSSSCRVYGSNEPACPHGTDGSLAVCMTEKPRRVKLIQLATRFAQEKDGSIVESDVTTHIQSRKLTKVPENILAEARKRNQLEIRLRHEQEVAFQASLNADQKQQLMKLEEKHGGRDKIPPKLMPPFYK